MTLFVTWEGEPNRVKVDISTNLLYTHSYNLACYMHITIHMPIIPDALCQFYHMVSFLPYSTIDLALDSTNRAFGPTV